MGKRAKGFKNLRKSEIKLADHYAETGNMAGLRQMLNKSAERSGRDAQPGHMLNPLRMKRYW